MPKKGGFTLLELIIVIALSAILATMLLIATKPSKRLGQGNDQRRNLDAQSIEQAIKVVALDTGSVPTILKNLTENTPYAIVQAGGSTSGTYNCAVLGGAIDKQDISSAISSVMTTMPVDPSLARNSNDTGYYIKRIGSLYDVEPCSTYRLAATTGTSQVCGDGYCGSNESCSSCSIDCGTCPPVCGNGIREGTEQCDDGNAVNTDACKNDCTNAICGDSVVWAGVEQCDDGNSSNTDACLNTCVNATCGDSFVRAGVEQCDDGNAINTDDCTTSCLNAACGDSYVWAGHETCDDHNLVDEGCGNNVIESAGSYCNSSCSATVTISVSESCEYANSYYYCDLSGVWCGLCSDAAVNCPSHESPSSGRCQGCIWNKTASCLPCS